MSSKVIIKKQIFLTKQPSLAKVETAKQSLSMCILQSLWEKLTELFLSVVYVWAWRKFCVPTLKLFCSTFFRVICQLCESESAVRPYLAKFRHFGKSFQVFCKILAIYFLFGKKLSLLWQICDVIGLIFIDANGQILKNNLTIWSHWVRVIVINLMSLW